MRGIVLTLDRSHAVIGSLRWRKHENILELNFTNVKSSDKFVDSVVVRILHV